MRPSFRHSVPFAFVLAVLAGCEAASPPPSSGVFAPSSTSARAAVPSPSAPVEVRVRTRWPAAERVVAVGDLHGDLAATRRVLALAGVLKDDHWSGGKTVLVQTGDVLDRGDGERAIVELLERLGKEARASGGEVVALNGNHELMNAAGDFRYVTPGGFQDFHGHGDGHAAPSLLERVPPAQRERAGALFPGGGYAQRFATHPVVAVVGDTVFVHGGLLPKWAKDIEGLNHEVGVWLAGGSNAGARVLAEDDSPVWSRRYAESPDDAACAELDRALALVGAKRMVVGHTVMKAGIAPACEEKLWRIDVGLAAYYGGKSSALELGPRGVHVLTE